MSITDTPLRECNNQLLINQIGMMTILGVSGGRIILRETGITLPVSHGYKVEIDLAWNDTYIVKRTLTRGAKYTIKGQQTDVHFPELSEIVWNASCYKNIEFGEAE